MKRFFEEASHARIYAQHRPSYPSSVLETVLKFCREKPHFVQDLAIDVGCGSGQFTQTLAPHFKAVIGTDVSKAQILNAQNTIKENSITFEVHAGEDLSFQADSSVDLLTCAQAFHWLDAKIFYREALRILKPNGVLALIGYGNAILNRDAAMVPHEQFYNGALHDYWDPQRKYIEEKYKNVDLPFPYIRVDTLCIERHWTVSEYVGYVRTWSAYQNYMKDHPGSQVLEDLQKKLEVIYADTDSALEATWPIFILMGHNPAD
ncbi:unnamed protein product [Owenia fusiformis]|uniref:Uncharacterized protein n=1 Tax=Owenia fusiformis TaxID=6347 RepID=A0A8J1TES4_OWEFU|nr:unnamed protein product [Owenia fusiformis]